MQDRHDNVLEVISDSICPWCYIGKRRLEGALKLLGARAPRVVWRPFQLNPGMPLEGMDRREYRTRKFGSWEYSQQLDARVRAAAQEVELRFDHEKMTRTPNTLASHKLVLLAMRAGCADAVVEGIFQAYFVEGRDIGNPDVLAEIGAAAGLAKEEVVRALSDDALTAEVQREEEHARRYGVNGVPTFVLNGLPLASGALPAEELARLIASHSQSAVGTTCRADGECA